MSEINNPELQKIASMINPEVARDFNIQDVHEQLGITPIQNTQSIAPVQERLEEENYTSNNQTSIDRRIQVDANGNTLYNQQYVPTQQPIQTQPSSPVQPMVETPTHTPTATPEPKKITAHEALNNILSSKTVDLNTIELVEKSPLTKIDDFEFVLKGKPTFQVVANQSSYIAYMESLKMVDINAITNSTLDLYQQRVKLYQTVYSKINTTSLGKISYKDWLKITSFFDLSSLLYGIYAQTFPGDTDFQIGCRHCKETVDAVVNNERLISVRNEETYQQFDAVLASIKNPAEALEKSIVNKITRSMLPSSKIIINVQTPSLWNHLELLSTVDKNKIHEMSEVLSTLLFVKSVFMVDVEGTLQSGTPKYYEVTDKNEIFAIVQDLEFEDVKALGKAIEERTESYAIEFKIKDFPCPKCGNSIGEIPIDVESLLFQQILQQL